MKKKSKLLMKLTALAFAVTLLILPANTANASTKSDAENVLKYYQKGNISKAKKYNKKLSKNPGRACIRNLSTEAKNAYKKVVKKYRVYSSSSSGKEYLWGYYLVDMDGDKKAELLVKHGTCEADVRTTIYTYKNGKAKKIKDTFSGHTSYYAYPGHAGVICVWGHMGCESVSTQAIKKGKFVSKSYGGRDLNKSGAWFPFRQMLYDHINYDKNYKASVDWNDLQ